MTAERACTAVMAAMVRISSPHWCSLELKSYARLRELLLTRIQQSLVTIRAMLTSTGHSATFSPTGVRRPSSPTIPAAARPSKALRVDSAGGAVTHSNFMRSSIPKAFNWIMGAVMSVRVISGGVVRGKVEKAVAG